MSKKSRTITASKSQDVWLHIPRSTWSNLPLRIQQRLRQALDRIVQIRLDIARHAKVQTMPPVVVVAQIWAFPQGEIDGLATVVPFKQGVVFGVQLPVLPALCDDTTWLRRLLVHEFLHCFWHYVSVARAMSRGETSLDTSGYDVFDPKDDDALLENANDWFGGDDARSLMLHGDQSGPSLSSLFLELRRFFPVLVPSLRFTADNIQIPDDIHKYALELIRRRDQPSKDA